MPNNNAKILQLLTALKPLEKLPFANSLDTIVMQARFNPEVAIVIANIYTDITKSNIPTASEPILFDIYIPNIILILLITTFVIVNIEPLIRNFFVLFKISPFNFISFI